VSALNGHEHFSAYAIAGRGWIIPSELSASVQKALPESRFNHGSCGLQSESRFGTIGCENRAFPIDSPYGLDLEYLLRPWRNRHQWEQQWKIEKATPRGTVSDRWYRRHALRTAVLLLWSMAGYPS